MKTLAKLPNCGASYEIYQGLSVQSTSTSTMIHCTIDSVSQT